MGTRSEKIKATKERKAKEQAIIDAQRTKERNLKDLRESKINEPTIIRKVGDKVSFGFHIASIIKEVLDDGKIYLIEKTWEEGNYGRPYNQTSERYVVWHDCSDYYTEEQINDLPKFATNEFRLSFMNTTINNVVCKYYSWHGKIDMNPSYQRKDVWSVRDKAMLVDSIMKGIDIGKLVLVKHSFEEMKNTGWGYEVLDGKQRIQAIIDFIEGRFQYKGYFYRELSHHDRISFEGAHILIAELPESTTYEEKLKHFLRVNTSGKQVDKEHLDLVRDELAKELAKIKKE